MGRPKINGDRKRSEKITFRVTVKEQLQIEKAADLCGQATGNFIRYKLFKGRFPEPKISKVDLNTYLELKKIGVNVNQLAKQVNAGKVPIAILAILDKLMLYQEKIIRLLLNDSHSE